MVQTVTRLRDGLQDRLWPAGDQLFRLSTFPKAWDIGGEFRQCFQILKHYFCRLVVSKHRIEIRG